MKLDNGLAMRHVPAECATGVHPRQHHGSYLQLLCHFEFLIHLVPLQHTNKSGSDVMLQCRSSG